MKRLLVTTDFSPEAQAAFHYAREYAQLVGTANVRISLLHVLEDLGQTSLQLQFARAVLESHGIHEELAEQAKKGLEEVATLHFAGLPVEHEVVQAKKPVHVEILEHAQSKDSDLIIMATHGRTGVAHAVLGSVSERLIRISNIPILVVPTEPRTAAPPQE